MNEQFQEFFKKLARRFRSENHLSDFTYVALEVIPEFKKDFVHFFHPSLEISDNGIEVIREFTLKSSDQQPSGRPDFLLRCNAWDLIVENKIWDSDYHFGQYGVTPLVLGGRKPLVGLIANHKVEPTQQSQGWAIKTWDEFVEYFANKKYSPYDDVFSAYIEYVNKVCAMTKFNNFKFDANSLHALAYFARMIRATLDKLPTVSNSMYEISVKDDWKWNFGETWAGCFFELKRDGSNLCLFLFFGIDFDPERKAASITIDLHKGDNVHFPKIINQFTPPQYCEKVNRREDGMVQLRMREERFTEINNEPSKEKQLESLEHYLLDCCNALFNAIKS